MLLVVDSMRWFFLDSFQTNYYSWTAQTPGDSFMKRGIFYFPLISMAILHVDIQVDRIFMCQITFLLKFQIPDLSSMKQNSK
jgi:hypothetical protein